MSAARGSDKQSAAPPKDMDTEADAVAAIHVDWDSNRVRRGEHVVGVPFLPQLSRFDP